MASKLLGKKITDIFLFLRILGLVMALPIIIKIFSLPRLMNILTPKRRKENISEEKAERAILFTNFILKRNFFIFHPTCLKRSLVLYRFLNKYGMDVSMNFGVKKENGKLDGHGWLTRKGKPIFEEGAVLHTFRITYSFPEREP